jgi:hypothetical protein
MSSDQSVTATFNALAPPATTPITGGGSPHPAGLASPALRFGVLKRSARHFKVTVGGLPPGTKVAAVLLAGHTALARASATVGVGGTAILRFTFTRAARRRLRSHELSKVRLDISATLAGAHAPSVLKTIRLAR